jgi:Asp-tRNA(Asn)/Glu-tRNA(Gln) amidotransferase A subunit family amidase
LLAEHIANRTYSAVRVVQAYARTAAIAQQATNCLTDYFVDEAVERATWLDEEMERRGGVVGPLHGVVISVKGECDATTTTTTTTSQARRRRGETRRDDAKRDRV